MSSADRRRAATCRGTTAAMSSAKRRRVVTCHRMTAAVGSDPPHIPGDLLMEIFARADGRTIVRVAATCKRVRRAIFSPDFRRRHAARGGGGGGGGGFDPDLLLGASCIFYKRGCVGDVHFQEQRRPFSFDTESLIWYEPMVSRGCLVVLHRRHRVSAELRVVNTLTGDVSRVRSPGICATYPRALLSVGDAGGSFQLLVATRNLVTSVFSSEKGGWGGRVHARLPPNFLRAVPNRLSPPLVLGGTTVHWLCKEQGIVALDVGTATATVIDLPPHCFRQVRCPRGIDKGLLASSADGRLSLLVAEPGAIAMWSLSATASSASSAAAARWSRQVVIPWRAIARQRPGCAVRFLRFGERSGAVMLQMEGLGLVQIDLGTREGRVLNDEFKEIGTPRYSLLQLCLHETDRPTLLEGITKKTNVSDHDLLEL